jgi:hypothetical protein
VISKLLLLESKKKLLTALADVMVLVLAKFNNKLVLLAANVVLTLVVLEYSAADVAPLVVTKLVGAGNVPVYAAAPLTNLKLRIYPLV